MRHLFVATALVVTALTITFGVASFLQGVSTARREVPAEPISVGEPARVPTALRPGPAEFGRRVSLVSRRGASAEE